MYINIIYIYYNYLSKHQRHEYLKGFTEPISAAFELHTRIPATKKIIIATNFISNLK